MCVFARCSVAMVLMFCISAVLETSAARPAIIHEQDRVAMPDPYDYVLDVCLSGDDLLVLAVRDDATSEEPANRAAYAIVHFARQADGQWLFTQELAATFFSTGEDIWLDPQLDCDGPVAGVSTAGEVTDSFILERTASGWMATPLGHNASNVAVYGDSVAFGGERGGSPTAVAVYSKDASGSWTDVRYALVIPVSATMSRSWAQSLSDTRAPRLWRPAMTTSPQGKTEMSTTHKCSIS